jgi:hypothetical protein
MCLLHLIMKHVFPIRKLCFIMNIVSSAGYLKYTRFGLAIKYSVNSKKEGGMTRYTVEYYIETTEIKVRNRRSNEAPSC